MRGQTLQSEDAPNADQEVGACLDDVKRSASRGRAAHGDEGDRRNPFGRSEFDPGKGPLRVPPARVWAPRTCEEPVSPPEELLVGSRIPQQWRNEKDYRVNSPSSMEFWVYTRPKRQKAPIDAPGRG